MAKTLLIAITFGDDSDLDFLRVKCVGAVEDVVDEFVEEERNDGVVEVSWEVEDK